MRSLTSRKTAFTLIELLVVIMLLSLLVATSMFAFKFLISRSSNTSVVLPKRAIHYELLNQSISGIYPYVVEKKEDFDEPKLEYFFNAKKNFFSYITTNPIYYEESCIAKVYYTDSSLFYSESPLYHAKQNYKKPEILTDPVFQTRLLEDISKFTINYSILEASSIPAKISVHITHNEKEYTWIFSPKTDFHNLKDLLKEKGDLF
jgi:prepilin-type N-terminal cleavage/methylation domain-containing protein